MWFLKHFRETKIKFSAPMAPGEPLAVIGDIHGRADLLDRLLEKLAGSAPDHRVIFVGDYIDRGDQSAQVLERLRSLQQDSHGDPAPICLTGNHEVMLLAFLDGPAESGARWLRFGGLQTMASYGITPPAGQDVTEAEWLAARDGLRAAMGPQTEEWLRGLPYQWQSGNVATVHAAADPARPMSEQDPETLAWGHRAFESEPRSDGIWIVHGHTVVDSPLQAQGRLSIDTGAYATGRLTAALIGPDGSLDYLQA